MPTRFITVRVQEDVHARLTEKARALSDRRKLGKAETIRLGLDALDLLSPRKVRELIEQPPANPTVAEPVG